MRGPVNSRECEWGVDKREKKALFSSEDCAKWGGRVGGVLGLSRWHLRCKGGERISSLCTGTRKES